jgi:hypothetical protein
MNHNSKQPESKSRCRCLIISATLACFIAALGLMWALWGWDPLRLIMHAGGSIPATPQTQANAGSALPLTPALKLDSNGTMRAGRRQWPTNQTARNDASGRSVVENRRAALLQSPYGKAPIVEVLNALNTIPGGPELQMIFQVISVRKDEALPFVKARLQSGQGYEKHTITKLLRVCPWPETKPELLALARDKAESWLARQGALYALGALGDVSTGPEVAALLDDVNCPKGVQLVAIATLARTGYRDGASVIRSFTEDQDIHVRLFAARALAELGEPVNREPLVSSLQNTDYLVRQEACEALALLDGTEVSQKLQDLSRNDPHEAVRDAASQALLKKEIRDLSPVEKLAVLKRSLDHSDRHNCLWIVQTILAQCGLDGRILVENLAAKDNYVGERSAAFLLFSSSDISRP